MNAISGDRVPLTGRTTIVTGASSGIGEATARELARLGASVVLAARDGGRLRALEAEISASGGDATVIETDVTDRASVEAMVAVAGKRYGGVDFLVNNAGMGLSGRVSELRAEDVRHVYEVNVLGVLNCVQATLPHLSAGGRIVNVSSVVGMRSIPMVGGYCSSKFALNALTDALRVEVALRGIHVTSVYPGTTRTDFRENARRTGGEKRGWRPSGVPPEKVAKTVSRVLAARKPPRDAYVSFTDHLFIVGVSLFPGLTDVVLRLWARG
ncbi:SDR family NAD(P)-dependent oxidoreductase [Rubrobacter indicoceani]|uniref:SDR family NAD(P)-dependent oxidoreductase n=1 Tax=Rubrobacter indicoceani TaxID=2051957 RepID=UPI000E5AD8FF|nr:SDR family NAD(P)-dependent oxidoreductase [Rubrobacter indicoceani]